MLGEDLASWCCCFVLATWIDTDIDDDIDDDIDEADARIRSRPH